METFIDIFDKYLLAKKCSINLFCSLYGINMLEYLKAESEGYRLDVMLKGKLVNNDLENKYLESCNLVHKVAELLIMNTIGLEDEAKREIREYLKEKIIRISDDDSSIEDKLNLNSYNNFMTYLNGTMKQKTL